MDKTEYNDKMDSLVNEKETYEVFKGDLTPALQRKLNNKLLTLKKPTRSTFDATTDGGVVFSKHPSYVDYQNYTNPTYLCGP